MKQSRIILSTALAFVLVGSGVFGKLAYAADDQSGSSTAGSTQSSTTNAQEGTAKVSSKEEVVYGTLSATGTASNVYVVNEFDVAQGGTLVDYGDYSSVSNLTSNSTLEDVGDRVSTTVDQGEFYYQGTLSNTNLPWLYSIEYTLDGKAIPATDVAGKSGALQIHLTTKKNSAVDSSYYDNYMQQISITLDGEVCGNIVAEGTTIANSGKDKVVTATVMPGKDGDVTVTTDVKNFSMSGIQIAAMPLSMSIDLSGTDDIAGQMTPLVTGVSSLNDGMQQLAAGAKAMSDGFNSTDLNIDTSSFKQLSAGLRSMADGLNTIAGSIEYTNTNYFKTSLDGLGYYIDNLPSTPPDVDSLTQLLQDHYDAMAADELTQLITAYTNAMTVKGAFYDPNMQAGLNSLSTLAGILTSQDPSQQGSLYYLAGNLTYMADQIDAALNTMDFSQLTQLGAALTQLSTGIQQAADGVSELNNGVSTLPDEMQKQINDMVSQYDKSDFKPVSFTSSKNPNPSLVQFVITSDGIQVPKEATATTEPEETPSVVDKFLDLFN